jgi:Protein of unknown function (DUF3017)
VEESVLTQQSGGPDTDSPSALTAHHVLVEDGPDTGETPAVPVASVTAAGRPARWVSLPYAIALAGLAGGLAWIWLAPTMHIQAGTVMVASALIVAAVERLVLPERRAGLLVSRRRLTDVVILAGLGAGILAVALVLPSPS